ncbi:hypothetical protein ACFVVL_27595 [Kitasatospora sp. NPDC058115]|uniref:hypothetical protein n=1 Tax=Kitasatospora sp. NPDC058115 TaxID=3346347 RepID=UPI0036DF3272
MEHLLQLSEGEAEGPSVRPDPLERTMMLRTIRDLTRHRTFTSLCEWERRFNYRSINDTIVGNYKTPVDRLLSTGVPGLVTDPQTGRTEPAPTGPRRHWSPIRSSRALRGTGSHIAERQVRALNAAAGCQKYESRVMQKSFGNVKRAEMFEHARIRKHIQRFSRLSKGNPKID